MPTADAQMIKLPRRLVERIDAARGQVDRPAFLDALLDEYERQDGHAQSVSTGGKRMGRSRAEQVQRPDPTRVRRESPKGCPHPETRRIGDACAECGTTGLKKRG